MSNPYGKLEVEVPRGPWKTFTDEELHDAFDLVKNRNNWKMPIRGRVIPEDKVDAVVEAISYFCGSPSEVYPHKPGFVKVYAAGYYACIGS